MYRPSKSGAWRPVAGLQDLTVASDKSAAYQISWALRHEKTYSGYYKAQLFRQVDLLNFYHSQEDKERRRIDLEAQARRQGLPIIGFLPTHSLDLLVLSLCISCCSLFTFHNGRRPCCFWEEEGFGSVSRNRNSISEWFSIKRLSWHLERNICFAGNAVCIF